MGPMMAGVIDQNKFVYNFWKDTVSTKLEAAE
jgi:hypothetical protein